MANEISLSPRYHAQKNIEFLAKKPAKALMINCANRMSQRHFTKNCDGDENEDSEEDSSFVCHQTLTKKQILQKVMENAIIKHSGRTLQKSMAHDFKMFEATKERIEFLETLCQALMTAKPTSVDLRGHSQ